MADGDQLQRARQFAQWMRDASTLPYLEDLARQLEDVLGRAQNAEMRLDDSIGEDDWNRLQRVLRASREYVAALRAFWPKEASRGVRT